MYYKTMYQDDKWTYYNFFVTTLLISFMFYVYIEKHKNKNKNKYIHM